MPSGVEESRRRVAVTGIGVAASLGLDEAAFSDRLFAGKGGIGRLTALDGKEFRTRIASEVDRDELGAALAGVEPFTACRHNPDPVVGMAFHAADRALRQAGLIGPDGRSLIPETAVIFGGGGGMSWNLFEAHRGYHGKGVRGVRPTTVPRCMMNCVSSELSIGYGLTGPNYMTASACAASTVAMGLAFRFIQAGLMDTVLCGGSESMYDPVTYSSWDRLGVLSRNPDPERAFRPFDRRRDGFVIGEGAGAFVVEPLDRARARGASIRAEICGYGEGSDAKHISQPSVRGRVSAMRGALASAGLEPGDVDLISAHGTATELNDVAESRAIREVFGDGVDSIPVVSGKPYFGHLVGAAGIVETAATVFCLEQDRLHPNLNLDEPDPLCDLCFQRKSGDALKVAMKNSFGLGGNNAVLIIRKYDG